MNDNSEFLKAEDYAEPRCPLCEADEAPKVPVARVIEKLDSYLGRGDAESAEKLLCYWLGEAEALGDERGKLSVLSELMGLTRKLGKPDALKYADEAVALVEKAGLSGTVTAGTTYINAATCRKAFGYPEISLELFEKARALYEELLSENDERMGGLYNNMALTLADLKRYKEAREAYYKALAVMQRAGAKCEMAITYVNLACLENAENGRAGDGEIVRYMDEAKRLLVSVENKDRYYAFTLEKCAPAFGAFGDQATQKYFEREIEEIYERH